MKKLLSHFRLLVLVTNCLPYSYAVGQEVALTPVETAELARGYSGEALKRKTVVNEKGETLG
ncbi:hypothetical protein ABTN86_19385, partial [Acinetobacter baumannii]